MGVRVQGGKSMGSEVGRFLSRAVGHEQKGLAKAMVKSGESIAPTAYDDWAGGEFATGEYQRGFSFTKKGTSYIVGNVAAHSNVVEFGADAGSIRQARMAEAKLSGRTLVYRPGRGAIDKKTGKLLRAKTRRSNIKPLKVLARSITMGFDATENERRKRKSLDGKGLK